ncbi:MAG: DUF58 domain-containing protein [Spirochaetaceae bacterium]|nr:MAG: DUF58 domain-containing protein [Spirochaetaceae bacterium]
MRHGVNAAHQISLRWSVLILLFSVAVATGLLTRSSFPFVLSVPILFYALSGQTEAKRSFRAEMTADRQRISAGDEVAVRVTIHTDGPVPFLQVRQTLPEQVEEVSGDFEYSGSHDGNEPVVLAFVVRCPRGIHVIAAPLITSGNSALLQHSSVQVPQQLRIHAVPRVHPPRSVAVNPPAVNLFPGIIASRRAGSGTQFFDLRAYRPGDSLRRVSRKSIHGRSGSAGLIVTEFEEERAVDVSIILDVRRMVYVSNGMSLFEAACEGAAALTERFIADGNRVSLLLYGGPLQWAPPGYGKRRKEMILNELAEARLREHGAFRSLGQIPLHLLRSGTQLVLVSPLETDDAPDLCTLHARGFRVLVLRPDRIEASADELPDDRHTRLARRIVRLEHHGLNADLERNGILVLNWPQGQSLAECFALERARFTAWGRHR